MKLLIGVFFILLTNAVHANPDEAALDKVLYELKVIKKIINDAELKEITDKRYVFKWECLLEDIHKIESGLNDWRNRELLEPRAVEPVKGDYLGT